MIAGLDIGTSVTKAAAFDDNGEAVAVEAVTTRLRTPAPSQFEHDVEEVLEAAFGVIRRLCERLDAPPAAIGITGQGDGLWLVDERGKGVRPAISWMDARAAPIVAEWLRESTLTALFRHTGNAPFPGAGAALLAALDRSEPEALDRAATAARCKDVIFQRLTGVRATDVSEGSNLFMDVRTRRRDEYALALCGLAHRAPLLAPAVRSGFPTGELEPAPARALGLAPGLPVTAGPYDLPACAAGAGVTSPGDGLLILGTTLACQVVVDRVDTTGEPAGLTLCTAEPDRWLRAMPAMVGTAALDWVLGLVGADHEALDDILDASPPGARRARALPFLSPAGERAPFVAPQARACLAGLTLTTTGPDVVRAVCEGIAYAARHCLDEAGLTGSLTVCGGGAASAGWLQVLSDVMQRPLRIARGPEVGARGAAMAAAATTGAGIDAAAWTASRRKIEPRADFGDLYAAGYARYRNEVERARATWAEDS
jgi:erythritol kinase (D-erythritol 1-phosphate-forming)